MATLTRPMLEELLALTAPGEDDDEPVAISLRHMNDGPDGPGLYAFYSEYPEEGVTLIDGKSEVLRAEGRASVDAPMTPADSVVFDNARRYAFLRRGLCHTILEAMDLEPGRHPQQELDAATLERANVYLLDAVQRVTFGPEAPKGPCTVCGKPLSEHGSYPTCATHAYTPNGQCQTVLGASCFGAECVNGCVRMRGSSGNAGVREDGT